MSTKKGFASGLEPPEDFHLVSKAKSEEIGDLKDGNKAMAKKKVFREERVYQNDNGQRFVVNHYREEDIHIPSKNTRSSG
jgi:hypothetical protein